MEVEDFFHTNPNVKDAAAIGLPDERLGEIVAVIIEVVPGKTLTVEEVQKFSESPSEIQETPQDILRRGPEKSDRQDREAEA